MTVGRHNFRLCCLISFVAQFVFGTNQMNFEVRFSSHQQRRSQTSWVWLETKLVELGMIGSNRNYHVRTNCFDHSIAHLMFSPSRSLLVRAAVHEAKVLPVFSIVLDKTSMFTVFTEREGKTWTHSVKALQIIWNHFPQLYVEYFFHIAWLLVDTAQVMLPIPYTSMTLYVSFDSSRMSKPHYRPEPKFCIESQGRPQNTGIQERSFGRSNSWSGAR